MCERNLFPFAESLALNDGLISLLLWIICAYVCVSGLLSLSSQTLISSCHKLRIGDNPSYKGSSLAFHLSGCLAVCCIAPLTTVSPEWKSNGHKANFRHAGNLSAERSADVEFDGWTSASLQTFLHCPITSFKIRTNTSSQKIK